MSTAAQGALAGGIIQVLKAEAQVRRMQGTELEGVIPFLAQGVE